ncbi:MAG: Bax inhibitor-1/YccA family protein [Clostridium sp.]|nr:Bax inhibitor-1/YccA family protein [Clostridium sp.]MCM1443700.1 Bax inhibitor-1/YccA family protein [Candidatus Amulumruptor caecigallinarius]
MNNKLYSKIYLWLFLGLLVSFATGLFVSTQTNMLFNILKPSYTIIIFLVEIFIAVFLGMRVTKMNPMTAKILYFVYSFTTGLSLSLIFVVYEITSIIFVFAITAGLFLIFAIIGKVTNLDLSKFGTILLMALIGIIIATIINMFIGSTTFDMILCWIGIIVFLGYIAYDMQQVKRLQTVIPDEDNLAIFAAFQLYLDFINLFYRLISLFGKSRD